MPLEARNHAGSRDGTDGAVRAVARAPDLDLSTVNRWFCVTRLRATGAIACFAVASNLLGIGDLRLVPTLAVCVVLAGVSAVGLNVRRLERVPRAFFYAQNLADLIGITVGLHYSTQGLAGVLFRPIYALTIVPASLLSFRGGRRHARGARPVVPRHGRLRCCLDPKGGLCPPSPRGKTAWSLFPRLAALGRALRARRSRV